MDVSALNLAIGGAVPGKGAIAAPDAVAVDGVMFAKLLSGLGVTEQQVAVPEAVASGDLIPLDGSPVDGEAPPADPALLPVGTPVAAAAAKTAKGHAVKDATADDAEPADSEAPTTASLGLPPLLAALIAPTLAQAAPAPQDGSIRAQPAPAGTVITPATLLADVSSSAAAQPPAAAAATSDFASAPSAAAPSAPPADDTDSAVAVITAAIALPKAVLTAAPGSSAAASPAAAAVSSLAIEPKATHGVPAAAVAAPAPLPLPASPLPTSRRLPSGQTDGLDAAAPATARAKSDRIVDTVAPFTPASISSVPPVGPAFDRAETNPTTAAAEPAPAGEPLIEAQLDMAHEGEWLDQLTRDIVRSASSEGSLRFRLNPEHLGSLQVEVTQGQAGASVRLTADTEQARSLIADARPQLIAEARAQGVRIAEAHVDLGRHGEGQGQSAAQSQTGTGGRSGREFPAQEYLTSWQPESAEEEASLSRRSSAERYA